ncbi:adenylyltransferase and sulfurtransferase MOCS3 [Cloeon dipterum]|uniref:adenylyltransferase and sulfurtransferase MOCS3 n=1 Tax=Cloeon dipterum TaxID=197152 RepID=UPI003220274E
MASTVEELELEISKLRLELLEKEKLLAKLKSNKDDLDHLTTEDIVRFSRQIILPQIGVSGQTALKNARILVVGAGGLGCPVMLYLAKAGVGRITVVDSDHVEVSNLHRQTLHSDATIGVSKVQSAFRFFAQDNGYTEIVPIEQRFTPLNSDSLVGQCDVVVDASDNIGTRYLLNDACVKHKKPLVSGSALGLEGQVTVYNANVEKDGCLVKGPCYRCLFPVPPTTTNSCSEAGVLGAVPGLIGLIQSIEVIKLIVNWPGSKSLAGRMIILDASDMSLRTVKLRLASEKCPACGPKPEAKLPYYVEMCGEDVPVTLLKDEERVTPTFVQKEKPNLLLIDVRSKGEFGMCAIEGSVNHPYNDFETRLKDIKTSADLAKEGKENFKVCFVCRRGNNSQLAAARYKEEFPEDAVVDMKGGLHNWAKVIDQRFPVY